MSKMSNLNIAGVGYEIKDAAAREAILHAGIGNRRFVILSDSYGDHVNSNGNNFYTQAMLDLGYTQDVDWYDIHLGGSGFIRPAPRNFTDLLIQNDALILDKDTITDVVVCSGANDQMTPGDILPNIQIFCEYVKEHYRNAKISIGCFTRAWEPAIIAETKDTYRAYEECVDDRHERRGKRAGKQNQRHSC